METCVGPHTYIIFTVVFLSFSYCVYSLEPYSISAKFIASIFALAGVYVAQKLIPRGRFKPEGKAVFITGCDTGIGHKLALRCDQIGLRVFAGCLLPAGADARTLSSESSKRLTIIPCDVTSDEAVIAARNLVSKAVIKEKLVFWACVNNAGIQRYAEIEMLPLQLFKDMMEVNTFGTVRVTKAFIPMIRESKGRFVNMTSVMARWCNPANAAYCMTKSAADTFNDVLRYEMHKWGVKVAIIHPGPYGGITNIISFLHNDKERADFIWNGMDEATKEVYGRAYVDTIEYGMSQHRKYESYRDITPVIDAMIDAILSKHPKHRYVIGGLLAPASYREFLRYNLLPTWLSDIKMYKQQEALGLPAVLQDRNKND
ncbi:D-beta-hydroxybutyrate dehydrogenase, mitochondrial-like [Amphiura filiformis]|uniref:D-beta-hydroxybutyrate dehydrogenase, mitochondrial-like n=1 Tax=Amphiura filiformis TaxID=82378 RepID=UPI003B20F015